MKWLDKIPFSTLVFVSLTLGLAPFVPEPHVWQKLKMLIDANLGKPVDIFDFFMHGAAWALLALKAIRELIMRK